MIRKFNPFVQNDYPTRDGRPMAETDLHRDLMLALIEQLRTRYADRPDVYVSGNLLIFYEEGNKRRHVSPDVFVVFGVPKGTRENYLLWEEGKGPDVVIELTSKTTQEEDTDTKHDLYLNTLGVKEYFLFDPKASYLNPPFQGFRRVKNDFRTILPKKGRLPSKLLGLHLERDGTSLRLWDPKTENWLLTTSELLSQVELARQSAEEELARLRDELERMKHQRPNDNGR